MTAGKIDDEMFRISMSKSHIHNTYTRARLHFQSIFLLRQPQYLPKHSEIRSFCTLNNQLDALRTNVIYIYIYKLPILSHEQLFSYVVLFFYISFLFFIILYFVQKTICVFCAIVSIIIDARFAATIGLSTEFPRYLYYLDEGRESAILLDIRLR